MVEIIPAILPKNLEDLKEKLALVAGAVSSVQIDVCDGKFSQKQSWPFQGDGFDPDFLEIIREESGLPNWIDFDFEIDLMTNEPAKQIEKWIRAEVKRIIFHIETLTGKDDFEKIKKIVNNRVEIGIAIDTKTPLEPAETLLDEIACFQFMGIDKDGFQGQKFNPDILSRIRKFKQKHPKSLVSVDGGVKLENAEEIIMAGANRLVVGSALFESGDILGNIKKLKKMCPVK